VYLDHWAFDAWGADPKLTSDFVTALRTSGGTLCFSILNAAEPCKASDLKHALRVDALLAATMPHVALVDLGKMAMSVGIPDTVDGAAPVSALGDPPLEVQLAFEFAMVMQRTSGPGWAEGSWLRRQQRGALFQKVSENIAANWDEQRQDVDWRKRARTAPLNRPAKRAWRVMADIMRPAVIDIAQGIPVNDGADCMHALVIPYCDFVLLDQKWAVRAEDTRRRFAEHGEKIGTSISARMGGVPKLIEELMTFGPVSVAPPSPSVPTLTPSDP